MQYPNSRGTILNISSFPVDASWGTLLIVTFCLVGKTWSISCPLCPSQTGKQGQYYLNRLHLDRKKWSVSIQPSPTGQEDIINMYPASSNRTETHDQYVPYPLQPDRNTWSVRTLPAPTGQEHSHDQYIPYPLQPDRNTWSVRTQPAPTGQENMFNTYPTRSTTGRSTWSVRTQTGPTGQEDIINTFQTRSNRTGRHNQYIPYPLQPDRRTYPTSPNPREATVNSTAEPALTTETKRTRSVLPQLASTTNEDTHIDFIQ